MLIVALPELTPVSEAAALRTTSGAPASSRSGGSSTASLVASATRDRLLRARAALEHHQLRRVRDEFAARAWLVPWQSQTLTGERSLTALAPG